MTNKNKTESKQPLPNTDVKMDRHQSAAYINSTYGTMSVWACKGIHSHLKPFKENGKVYYWQSNLDFHLRQELNPYA
ncbi:MAG: hypothetical protein J7621_23390 [Niastella sp.]|nr:hypothetical protein [Niastella sp.]